MSTLLIHAPSPDRTRANTWPTVTARLDRAAERRVRRAADRQENAAEALDTLDREWDIDRAVHLYKSGAGPDRVRAHSPTRLNADVDAASMECLGRLADRDDRAITEHISQLEREWDVERYLQLNAGLLSLAGVVAGATLDRRLLVLPAAIYAFLLQHAVQGWCPPLPVFRRLGVRTRREINRERYALKALRGDFRAAPPPRAPTA